MPVYEFDDKTMPEPEDFARLLREGDEQYDPLEELLRLERELTKLEREYEAHYDEALTSADFYQRYQSGKMGDDLEFVRWAGRYRLYRSLKRAISASLKMVLAEQKSAPS